MPVSTITSKYQTTVPREIREKLRLGPGDRLNWEVAGGELRVVPAQGDFLAWKGRVKVGKGSVADDVRWARERRGAEKW